MKKILAIAIVAIMTVALCISASATLNMDRIFVNHNVMEGGDDVKDTEGGIKIEVGDKLYILGWAAGAESNLKEIVYAIDDGENVACPDNYRDRADVGEALKNDALGVHAGFGHDTEDAGGLLELTGIDQLKDGTYKLTIKALYNDNTEEGKDYTLIVGTGVKADAQDGEQGDAQGDEQGDKQDEQQGDQQDGEKTDEGEKAPETGDMSIVIVTLVAFVALAGAAIMFKKLK